MKEDFAVFLHFLATQGLPAMFSGLFGLLSTPGLVFPSPITHCPLFAGNPQLRLLLTGSVMESVLASQPNSLQTT